MKSQDAPLERFKDKLLPFLLQAVGERSEGPHGDPELDQKPRPLLLRWPTLAAVLVAGAVVSLAAPFVSNDPLRGTRAIERHGDLYYLNAEDAAADPEEMTRELRAAGIDVTVEAVPVGPNLVGLWVQIANNGESQVHTGDTRIEDLIRQVSGRVMKLPADFSASLLLWAGREPRPGEQAMVESTSETLPGGLLHCVDRTDPSGVDRMLRERGYEVVWIWERASGSDESGSDPHVKLPGPPSDKVIIGGSLEEGSDDIVQITVADHSYDDLDKNGRAIKEECND